MINNILSKINEGAYNIPDKTFPKRLPISHIFDEDLSVKKNKELVAKHNEEIDKMKEEYSLEVNAIRTRLYEDIISAIMEETDLNRKQAEILYNFSYSRHHSSGEYEVVSCLMEYFEFAKNLFNAK